MRYLHLCFMTFAFSGVASFNTGILLSLSNRCEPSSHGSPGLQILQCYLFVQGRCDLDFDYVVRIVCLFNFIEAGFLSDAFVFALAIAIILYIGSFCKWKVRIDSSDFHSLFTFFEESSSRLFLVSLFVFVGWVLISDRISSGTLSVTVPPFRNLLRGDLQRGYCFLGSVFFKIIRGRTDIGFLESASAFALIFSAL